MSLPDRAIEDQSFGPCKHGDGCVEVVHARAVMASKRAAQRDRDIWKRQALRYREALRQIAEDTDFGDTMQRIAREALDD